MNPYADFRYRLEEAVIDEIACAGLFSAIALKAPASEQRQLIECISEDDEAHAKIFAAFISYQPMSVCQPIRMPEANGEWTDLLSKAIDTKLSVHRRYSYLADYAPTQAARYILLSVMTDELSHVRILEALKEAPNVEM